MNSPDFLMTRFSENWALCLITEFAYLVESITFVTIFGFCHIIFLKPSFTQISGSNINRILIACFDEFVYSYILPANSGVYKDPTEQGKNLIYRVGMFSYDSLKSLDKHLIKKLHTKCLVNC